MGRVLFAVCAFLGVCILGLAAAAYVTRDEDGLAVDNLLAESLTRAIALAEERDEVIEIDALTDFDWDRMLLVAPDTPDAEISAALGSEFEGELNYTVESNGLFVFARGSQMVRFADYRGQGRFEGVERPVDEFAPEDAVFEVVDLVARPAS